jgi:hypothetical protein
MRTMKTVLCGLALVAPCAVAQSPSRDGPLLAGVALEPTASYYFFYPAGSLRLVGWDRDSMAIHGHGKRSDFHLGRSPKGGKFFIEPAQGETSTPIDLVVYYPRRGTVSVKAASATIVASDVSGSYSTVSGTVRLTGSVSSLEAETMDGNIDLDVNTPWLRAHTSSGHLLIRGAPQDVDASTISGTLDIASSAILRGRFASVTGDIRYAATPARGALADFSGHAGTIDFLLPRNVSGRFDLSSVTGEIANGFTEARPVASGPRRLRLSLGRGDAQFTVRTFKGTIRVRPAQ